MKKNPIILLMISLLFIGFTACKKVDPSPTPRIIVPTPAPPPTSGSADFTKYIAIGNSLTAGFTNGGLYNAGMAVSYPNLLAGQFAQAGGGAFSQPLFGAGQENGSGYLKLTALPSTITQETTNLGIIGMGSDPNKTNLLAKYTGDLNNLGIPGLSAFTAVLPNYGLNNTVSAFNNYYERLLGTADATSSYADFLTTKANGATFFTYWLGNNDALGYAVAGGNAPALITSTTDFSNNTKALLDKMGTAKGAIINIGDVTTAAYFKTVTFASLKAALAAAGLPSTTDIYIATGAGPRAATAEDLFLLGSQTQYASIGDTTVGAGASGTQPYGLHPLNPFETQHVLDKDEVALVQTAISNFNTILQTEATSRGLAYVDIAATVTTASTTGYTDTVGGITYSTAFISGGIFSLDGLHFTPAGNALVANEVINAINTKYSATIPLLNPALFNTVTIAAQ